MSYEIYVGNIPKSFSREDVEELFSEFDGLKLLKFVKKDRKCFGFLSCQTIDQVISVIREKHETLVCGRTLIVRASDVELRHYVDLLLLEGNNESETNAEIPELVPLRALKNTPVYQKDNTVISDKFEKSSHSSVRSAHHRDIVERVSSDTACSSKIDISPKFSKSKQSYDSTYNEDFEEFTWVSVTNFPFHTSVRFLYQLFRDYDPIEVIMVSNRPRADRSLTEALVCFTNQDVANDVILNFDNTTFHGRLILVNDIEDLTIMNELLKVGH